MIGFRDRLRTTLRAFLLQGAWNPGGMQHLGALFSLRPMLDRIHGRAGRARKAAELRHGTYFNTHPYFAPILLGVAARLEEDLAEGRLESPKHVQLMVNRMSGPFAAVGDALFWETIRPATAFLGVWLILSALPGDLSLAAAGSFFFLGTYNLLTLPFRLWGVPAGYADGIAVIERLKKMHLQETMRRLRGLALFVLGLFLGLFLTASPSAGISPIAVVSDAAWRPFAAAVAAVSLYLVHRRVSPTQLLYGLLFVGLVAAGFAEAVR